MAFTHEEIMELENPYEELSIGDELAENAETLNALSEEDQVTLASRIIAACPEKKFKQYRNHIKALDGFSKDEESFLSVLSEAYQVRQSITALLDQRNLKPHSIFLKNEFNPSPFHRFCTLANQVLEGKATAIAERLTLCTPECDRSQVKRNLSITFPKHVLGENLEQAFVLRRQIETELLGDNPEKFFRSTCYNQDICKKFINIFHQLVAGHEKAIGEKLANLKALPTQSAIKHQLEILRSQDEESNPFKLMADSMKPKVCIAYKKPDSPASNIHGLFNKRDNMGETQAQEEILASSAVINNS
jgi:hypothetical protein